MQQKLRHGNLLCTQGDVHLTMCGRKIAAPMTCTATELANQKRSDLLACCRGLCPWPTAPSNLSRVSKCHPGHLNLTVVTHPSCSELFMALQVILKLCTLNQQEVSDSNRHACTGTWWITPTASSRWCSSRTSPPTPCCRAPSPFAASSPVATARPSSSGQHHACPVFFS